MFRTSQCPSSGSHELLSTEVTSVGSLLAVAACMVSVWLHILTVNDSNSLFQLAVTTHSLHSIPPRSTALTGAIDIHKSVSRSSRYFVASLIN
jgi:hypothetical protein